MSKKDELILKTVKEIVVKFIEVGNISPTSFGNHFRNIHKAVKDAVGTGTDAQAGDEENNQNS